MRRIDLKATVVDFDLEVRRFRCAAEAAGLVVMLDSSLASYPGSVHLHLRKVHEKRGVLEYTIEFPSGPSWLSVHSGRTADWIDQAIQTLLKE